MNIPETQSAGSPASAGSESARSVFAVGYFCAVATLIRMEGAVTTEARELFRCGGDPTRADDYDQKLFREVGLMPNAPGERPADKPTI